MRLEPRFRGIRLAAGERMLTTRARSRGYTRLDPCGEGRRGGGRGHVIPRGRRW
uniref:Uncharacterized protein n=1 Tax=Arundo donax TaxID=35708 RepID=A0A0A9GY11_ARUDO